MIITIRAGSSPVSRTKALKTLSFQGFLLSKRIIGNAGYVDPILEDPNVQYDIRYAVSLEAQCKLSGNVSGNESTGTDGAKKARQGGKTPSSDKSSVPNPPKPDEPKPDEPKLDNPPTPDSNASDEEAGKGTPKSPHPREGYEGLRRKRNEDGDFVWQKVPVKPTFIHPDQVEPESNDD